MHYSNCSCGWEVVGCLNQREPSLLVVLTPTKLQVLSEKRAAVRVNLSADESIWFEARPKGQIKNNDQDAECLRFEFKTKPSKSGPKLEDCH